MHKLKEFLDKSEMTQAELAIAVGVSQPTVSDWIRGRMRPSVDALMRISRVTGLSLDELMNGSDTEVA